jgi:phosphatidylglycerophosphate synthase
VAGRPLVFRAVVASVRAGVERVHVPGALREVLTPALHASPTALRAVAWMDDGAAPPLTGALVVPVTAPPPPLTLALLGRAPPTAVVEPAARGIPVAVMPPALLDGLWPSLCGGDPVGDRLEALLRDTPRTAVRAEAGAYVHDAAAVRRAEDSLYAGLGSVIDSPLDTAVHRRLSRHVSRFAVARGIAPNAITMASLVVGLAAALAFAAATPLSALLGLVLYLFAVVLDHADGEVARLTLTESRFGARLDIVVDTMVHAAVVTALGVATRTVTGAGSLLGGIAALGVVASAIAAFRTPVAGAVEDRLGRFLQNLGSRDGFYVMLLGFLTAVTLAPTWLPALMAVVAAGTHAYWVGRVAYRLTRRA